MDNLIEKSGYHGTFKDVQKLIQAKTYQSIKTKISYSDYLNSINWAILVIGYKDWLFWRKKVLKWFRFIKE